MNSRRIYATWDGAHMGSDLELSQADLIVTFTGTPTDNHRMVRGTVGLSVDSGKVNFLVWGTETLDTDKAFVGVATADADLSDTLGSDAFGVAYNLRTGEVTCNGATLDTFAPTPLGKLVRLIYDAPSQSISLSIESTPIGTVLLPAADTSGTPNTWHPAATISGTTAGGLQCWINAGQQDFPDSATSPLDGWWEPVPGIAPICVATEPYMAARDDAIPNQRFDAVRARIMDGENIAISRGADFWMEGQGSSTDPSTMSVRLYCVGASYEELINSDTKGLRAVLRSVEVGQPLSTAETLGEFIIDDVQTDGDFVKVITLKDAMVNLDVPAQGQMFLPNAQEQAANRPWPLMFGPARTFEPVLFDEDNRLYAASHVPMQALGSVLGKGRQAVAGDDFTVTAQGTAFQLTDTSTLFPDGKPDGKFTADASTVGDGFTPGGDDYLDGAGEWMSDTGGLPDGWDSRLVSTLTGPGTQPGLPYRVSDGVIAFPASYVTAAALGITDTIIKAGRSYAYKITVLALPSGAGGGPAPGGGSVFCIGFGPAVIGSGVPTSSPYVDGYANFFATGTYTGVFTNRATEDQALWLNYINGALDSVECRIGELFLQELPSVEEVPDLEGLGLEDFARAVIEQTGEKQPASVWVASDAAAIDAATGWKIGYWTKDTIQKKDLLKMAFDCFCAASYPRPDGRIGIAQLIYPESVADEDLAFDLSDKDMVGPEIYVELDRAEGLTNRAAYRRNYSPYGPSDFGQFDTSVDDGVPGIVRRRLGKAYQGIVYSGIPLPTQYRHALAADAFPTLFDTEADAQAFIDYAVGYYRILRHGYRVPLKFPPNSTLEVGQVGRYTYKYHGLALGKKLQIRHIDPFPAEQKAWVTFKG